MKDILGIKKNTVLFLIALFSLNSCDDEQIKPSSPVEVKENPENDEGKPSSKPSGNKKQIEKVGDGSGILKIHNLKGKKIEINPGVYQSIVISEISDTSIDGLGKVLVSNGSIDISYVDKVSIKGITIENYTQAAIYIHSEANRLTLQDLILKDIENYGIRFDISKKYDGTAQSYSQDIHLIGIQAENIGTLFVSQGDIKEDGFYGLIKGFKLKRSNVKNSPNLNGLTSLGLAENYEISENIVTNVNASDQYPFGMNTHTAIFFARGTGKVFDNKITNHQGNAVRAWLLSITEPGSVEIYNNIVYNSTRYGAFEVQVPPSIQYLQTFNPADVKIYNNTVGKLNTGHPKFFEGRLLDLYQTFGNVEIFNNLSFDLRDSELINNMSNSADTKITRQVNNRYFQKHTDAVFDLVDFKSRTPGVGAE